MPEVFLLAADAREAAEAETVQHDRNMAAAIQASLEEHDVQRSVELADNALMLVGAAASRMSHADFKRQRRAR